MTDTRRPPPAVVAFDDRSLYLEATVEYLRAQPGIGSVRGAGSAWAMLDELRSGADLLLLWARHLEGSSFVQVLDAVGHAGMSMPALVVDAETPHDDDLRTLVGSPVSVVDGHRSAQALAAAVRHVAAGHVVLPLELVASALQAAAGRWPADRHADAADLLTMRERGILQLLVSGSDRVSIARSLSLSPHTVRTHIGNMMNKLDAHSQVELAAVARRLWPTRTGFGGLDVSTPVISDSVSLTP